MKYPSYVDTKNKYLSAPLSWEVGRKQKTNNEIEQIERNESGSEKSVFPSAFSLCLISLDKLYVFSYKLTMW